MKMTERKKEVYNVIEICGMTVVSKTENLKEMMRVANKLLTKHKDMVKKEQEKIEMPSKYIG